VKTEIGRLVGQEGIVNLVRSFLFAGAPNSRCQPMDCRRCLYDVPDETVLRKSRKRSGQGLALQRAKLGLIEQFADQAVPFYWAGFTLVSEGSRELELA
jgi:hypothetical protein